MYGFPKLGYIYTLYYIILQSRPYRILVLFVFLSFLD